MKIYSNIVPEEKVREIQKETLSIIAKALYKTFGPKGSTTTIVKNLDAKSETIAVTRTKDGHTVVKNIEFVNPIERSVQDTLTDLTQYVVKEVGDGTTSAIILCKEVFDALCNDITINDTPAADVLKMINDITNEVCDRIKNKGRECTLDDIYNICLISTNNNEYISQTLYEVYKKYGLDVFIDIGVSSTMDCIVKEYDGMTMDAGYTNPCFVNMKETNQAVVRNPKIYCFKDPIDTPEMVNMCNAIIENNIIKAYMPGSVYEPVPTVIFCKKISSDTASSFERVVQLMNSIPDVPLLIVSDVFQDYLYEDISKMCGAPYIKKYLNPDIQKADIEAGLAPTSENILDFCGTADEVVADSLKTKIINPAKMFDENGGYSQDYKSFVTYLETEVQKCVDESAGIEATAQAKRRLNCFKGNMVDFLVGGLTPTDRDNLKTSVEDAVLNCRSAAINGVGYGANFMAFSVLNEMRNEEDYAGNAIVNILFEAYRKMVALLYANSYDRNDVDEIIDTSLSIGCPMNIRTNEYDRTVLSSIKSDIAVLETINKVLSLMYTCNQYLVPTPMHNVYCRDD